MSRKNVTVVLDETVARWARVKAARENTSVSRLLGDLLKEKMLQEQAYEAAMREFLAVEPVSLKRHGKYPRREELHGRTRVR